MLAHFLPYVAALLALNGWTMLRFWQDKQRAISGRRRIPEADLLGLALIGGSPGALLARQLFRHKTSKQPFSTRLKLIVVLQAALIVYLIAYQPTLTWDHFARLELTIRDFLRMVLP